MVGTSPFSNGFMGSLPDRRVIWEAFRVACQVGGQNDANEATNTVFLDIERCRLSCNLLKKKKERKKTHDAFKRKVRNFPTNVYIYSLCSFSGTDGVISLW